MNSKHMTALSDVEQTYQQLIVQKPTTATTIPEDILFDDVNYVCHDILKRLEGMKSSTEERWLKVFNKLNEQHIPHTNWLVIVQYVLGLTGTNASSERVFSLRNTMWTSKNVETLRAMLIIKFNMRTCEIFYEILNQNQNLVKKCLM